MVHLKPGRVNADRPLVPGKFTRISGNCALRESGELTCFTADQRLAKKPPGMDPGPDGSDVLGMGISDDLTIVHWGQVQLPSGPFVDLSGALDAGCAIDVHDHLGCWGESVSVRTFPDRLGPVAVARVSVASISACAVSVEGALSCLEGPVGRPGPERRVVEVAGRYASVELSGFDWAIQSSGHAVGRGTAGDFTDVTADYAGCFRQAVSDGSVTCGIDDGRVRCLDGDTELEYLRGLSLPTGANWEKIVPGHKYFCALGAGEATCFGDAESIPGGPLESVPARDVGTWYGLLCLVDPQGALMCRGTL